MTGSSPLTRGKPARFGRGHTRRGLIPAHAGKTPPRGRTVRLSWAHPRSRGENGQPIVDLIISVGSSPLTRGKHGRLVEGDGHRRLIPAHAGKTFFSCAPNSVPKAHPRSRGENPWHSTTSYSSGGSSPLTRGKLHVHCCVLTSCGLIPAHAGKTSWRRSRIARASAHPRSRGENRSFAIRSAPRPGSSPLTRGKRARRASPSRLGRLIPAHAGKTRSTPGRRG